MGKNHRHKKKLKSEKAKVHISSKTKFLPKGQNVTSTAFKIKPIVVQEQLKEKDTNQLLSKKKQSIPELINKLKHYNDTVKAEACDELTDIIKKHAYEALLNHLAQIIQNTSLLIQDKERKVRRVSIKLINTILEHVPLNKIATFFNFISSNLRCAMTNIDKNIQEDSLLLLDGLLEHAPRLIADNSEKLFPDFLALISKLRNDSGLDRTLTLNLGSKLTSVKWRIKVLSRLYGVLDAMIKQHKLRFVDNNKQLFSNELYVSKIASCAPIYENLSIYEACHGDFFNCAATPSNVSNVLIMHIAALVPLLYETWLEVVPEKTLKPETTILNEESAAILNCIVNILHLLHEYSQLSNLEKGVFSCKETDKFLDYLLSHFPYGHNRKGGSSEIKNFSKLFDSKDDPKCVEENLLIVYMFLILKINLNAKPRSKFAQISSYINRCLLAPNYINKSNSRVLMAILKEILLNNSKFWFKFGIDLNEILHNAITHFDSGRVSEQDKNSFLEILTSFKATSKSREYQDWLSKLPKLLSQSQVSERLINVILKLCKENHALVLDGVEKHFSDILENLKNVEITETSDENRAKLTLIYTFFYLPDLNSHFGEICAFIQNNPNLDCVDHLKNMLDVKQSFN